jgi:hypothetical protein
MIYCTESSSEVKFPSFHFLDEKSDLFTGMQSCGRPVQIHFGILLVKGTKIVCPCKPMSFPIMTGEQSTEQRWSKEDFHVGARKIVFIMLSEMPKPKVYIRHYILVLQVALN